MLLSLTIPAKAGKATIFSLPKTNDYQEITRMFGMDDSSIAIVQDPIYKNDILISQSRKSLELDFLYTPKVRSSTLPELIKLSDYTVKQKSFLINDDFINGNDARIQKIAKSLFSNETNVSKILKKAYMYCIENLTYGNPIPGLYPFDHALKEKVTDCGGFSTLLGSLIQSMEIPTRLVVGYVLVKNRKKDLLSKFVKKTYTFKDFYIHSWLEALLPDGTHFPMDPSVEWRRIHGLSTRDGGFGFLPNDRLVVSFGQNIRFSWHKKTYTVDILQDPKTL